MTKTNTTVILNTQYIKEKNNHILLNYITGLNKHIASYQNQLPPPRMLDHQASTDINSNDLISGLSSNMTYSGGLAPTTSQYRNNVNQPIKPQQAVQYPKVMRLTGTLSTPSTSSSHYTALPTSLVPYGYSPAPSELNSSNYSPSSSVFTSNGVKVPPPRKPPMLAHESLTDINSYDSMSRLSSNMTYSGGFAPTTSQYPNNVNQQIQYSNPMMLMSTLSTPSTSSNHYTASPPLATSNAHQVSGPEVNFNIYAPSSIETSANYLPETNRINNDEDES